MKKLPFLLVYSRLVIAVIIGILVFFKVDYVEVLLAILISLGVITDVFDGIIARKYGVATEKLRVWDSNVDQIFWLISVGAVFYLRIPFLIINYKWILLIIVLEFMAYVVSLLKFQKTIATHSILAKLWSLTLVAFLFDLLLTGNSRWLFCVCVVLGVISRIEIIAIILGLKKWTTDVASILKVNEINKRD